MKKHLCSVLGIALAATLRAAVPVAWTNSPGMAPHLIGPIPHGSSIDLSVTLQGYTTPPIADGADLRLWYQTNGMGKAWFSAPATLSSNVISSVFGPEQDIGADRVSLFFGAPSNVFAAAVLRLSHAPGFTPNALPLPVEMLDFAAVAYTNAPWLTRPEVDARIAELAPPTSLEPATNYTDEAIDILKGRLWRGDETVGKAASADYAYDAHIANLLRNDSTGALYYPTDFVLRATFTNDICNIVTNETEIGIGRWRIFRGSADVTDSVCQPVWDGEMSRWDIMGAMVMGDMADGSVEGTEQTVRITWEAADAETLTHAATYTAVRDRITRNALGLARLSDLPSTNGMVTAAALTNAVRSVAYAVNDYVWDGDVCWRRQMMQGGYLEYVAVTNIDVTLPENHEALEALEKARRNQK